MFFENNHLNFNIHEVRFLNQRDVNMFNSGRNFSALSYRLRADTVLKTPSADHKLTDNSVAFIPAGVDYTRISRVDEMIVVRLDSISYSGKDIESFVPNDPNVISTLFHKLLDCWNSKKPGYKYRCSSILYEILAECYAANYVSEPPSSPISKSVDFILSNYTRHDLSISEISAKSFISDVYFRKIFKNEYGISPQKYIINLRIKYATELIATGYYSLSEIATMSGYTDYKYFSAEFKRLIGISPSEYSKAHTYNIITLNSPKKNQI